MATSIPRSVGSGAEPLPPDSTPTLGKIRWEDYIIASNEYDDPGCLDLKFQEYLLRNNLKQYWSAPPRDRERDRYHGVLEELAEVIRQKGAIVTAWEMNDEATMNKLNKVYSSKQCAEFAEVARSIRRRKCGLTMSNNYFGAWNGSYEGGYGWCRTIKTRLIGKDLYAPSTFQDTRYYLGHKGGDYIFELRRDDWDPPGSTFHKPAFADLGWTTLEVNQKEHFQFRGLVPRPPKEYHRRLKDFVLPSVMGIIVSYLAFNPARRNLLTPEMDAILQDLANIMPHNVELLQNIWAQKHSAGRRHSFNGSPPAKICEFAWLWERLPGLKQVQPMVRIVGMVRDMVGKSMEQLAAVWKYHLESEAREILFDQQEYHDQVLVYKSSQVRSALMNVLVVVRADPGSAFLLSSLLTFFSEPHSLTAFQNIHEYYKSHEQFYKDIGDHPLHQYDIPGPSLEAFRQACQIANYIRLAEAHPDKVDGQVQQEVVEKEVAEGGADASHDTPWEQSTIIVGTTETSKDNSASGTLSIEQEAPSINNVVWQQPTAGNEAPAPDHKRCGRTPKCRANDSSNPLKSPTVPTAKKQSKEQGEKRKRGEGETDTTEAQADGAVKAPGPCSSSPSPTKRRKTRQSKSDSDIELSHPLTPKPAKKQNKAWAESLSLLKLSRRQNATAPVCRATSNKATKTVTTPPATELRKLDLRSAPAPSSHGMSLRGRSDAQDSDGAPPTA
jgi:hypothetical protein